MLDVAKLTDEELCVIDRGLSLIECNFPVTDDMPTVIQLRSEIDAEAIKREFV